MEDVTNKTGGSITLTCEVKGWPLPTVEWFVERDNEQHPVKLDNVRVSVNTKNEQRRGELTSWLQIVGVSKLDSGIYICKAHNAKGSIADRAYLTVGNFNKQFN